MQDKVIYEPRDSIAIIRLNRPERKNAMDVDSYSQFADAIGRAEADKTIRAILVAGGEGIFCSGNDVQGFLGAKDSGTDPMVQTLRFMNALHGAAKPVVAAVGGPAIGIGATLLLHCDLIVASESARFQFPFVRLGICPEFASPLLLQRYFGYQRAVELLLLGEPLDVQSAHAAGMVNAVVPDARLMDTALESARRFAELPPNALRTTKALLKKTLPAQVADTFAEELALVGKLMVSDEAREAFTAFLERRKPDFSKFS